MRARRKRERERKFLRKRTGIENNPVYRQIFRPTIQSSMHPTRRRFERGLLCCSQMRCTFENRSSKHSLSLSKAKGPNYSIDNGHSWSIFGWIIKQNKTIDVWWGGQKIGHQNGICHRTLIFSQWPFLFPNKVHTWEAHWIKGKPTVWWRPCLSNGSTCALGTWGGDFLVLPSCHSWLNSNPMGFSQQKKH